MVDGDPAKFHPVPHGERFNVERNSIVLNPRDFNYRAQADVHIQWRDVWVGAVITSLLFTIGKFLIGFYIGSSAVSSTYGAAGSLITVLLWVYYSSLIVFLGAELTQVYATEYGVVVAPTENAQPIASSAGTEK